MAIEIKITPRRIERVILLLIIFVLLGALYHYGYNSDCTPGLALEEATATNEVAEVKETEATVEEEIVEKEPEPEIEPTTSSGNLNGKITMTVSSLDVDKEGDLWIIDDFDISVSNGKDETQNNIVLNFYRPYTKDEKEFAGAFKPLNSNPITLPPIISGGTYTNSFRLSIPMKMYSNEDHTVKFEILQGSKSLVKIEKTVNP